MADLTKLDYQSLNTFINGPLNDFWQAVHNLRQPQQAPPSLYDISSGSFKYPLLIGQMSQDGDDTHGGTILANAKTSAKNIDTVLAKHEKAFAELKTSLTTVISSNLKTQAENLSSVDGQKFLSAIGAYDHDMNGGSTTPPPTTA